MSERKVPYHVHRKLEQKKVELVDEDPLTLRCIDCGTTWSLKMEGRKRLPKNYWRCPTGCNTDIGEKKPESTLKVLLVEDDKPLNKSLSAIMRKAGYDVDNVYTGSEMLAEIDRKEYDAVVLDVKLPDIEGTELLKKVREVQPVTGIIMMSGFATLEDAVESINHGADAFILKPVDPGDFLYRLGVLTGFKRLEREIRQARIKYNELYTAVRRD